MKSKEVSKTSSFKQDKELTLYNIFLELKNGNSPAKISKKLNINKNTLQYYLRKLKKDNIIIKEGYGCWKVLKEVSKTTKASQKKCQNKEIRGHAFNWRVKFNDKIDWIRRLEKYGVKYKLIGINKSTPRIILNNKKIWLTKNGLVVYDAESFLSQSSDNSKGMAVFELDKTIKMIGRKLNIILDGYRFTTSREHYGIIKNVLAKQYNDKKEKLYIRDDEGLWLWIDDSHSLKELETNEPRVNREVQNWWNDSKSTGFKVTPSFILEGMNNTNQMISQVTSNQLMFNNNFESHVEAIKTLSSEVKRLGEVLTKLESRASL